MILRFTNSPIFLARKDNQFMSIQAVAWVLEASLSRSFDRLVLISIANYAHKDGSGSCPSTKTIAEEAGVSERQVRYSVSKLVEIGELRVEYKASEYGTNVYILAKMYAASHARSEIQPGKHPASTRQINAKNETTILIDPVEPLEPKKIHTSEPCSDLFPAISQNGNRTAAVTLNVFRYFSERTGKNQKLYTLTEKRQRMGIARAKDLLRRVKGETEEEKYLNVEGIMKLCVDRMMESPFHRGENEQKKKWLEWELLFRSTEKMEKWLNEGEQ
jgi:DNA-binding Lrp family transcriptional regulator